MEKKVLIVDDIAAFRDSLNLYLTKMGFTDITMAFDGNDAFNLIMEQQNKGTPFDIIFSDINMPNCTGVELAQRIKKEELNVDLFIVSTETSQEIILDCIKAGAKDYLLKPYSETILQEKVGKLLKR
jgi:two-component system chemotaxis response regulator CheY